MTDRDDAVRPAESPQADPSRNATTHGLTARRPLCEREAERHRVLVEHWTIKHRPETEAEEALVQAAAIEYVRFLRCAQADELQMGPNARKALDEWRDKRRQAIRRKAQDLRDDPERVAAELHESAFGIDWMLRHWRELLSHLDGGRGWLGDDLLRAMHLTGRHPQKPPEGDVDGRRLWETIWRACPRAFDPRIQVALGDAEAVGALRAMVAERIERLEAMRPLAWEEVEGPEVDAIESSAMLDTTKEGQLRDRYRREAFNGMLRGLGMLTRVKVERSKMDDRLARQERLAAKSGPSAVDKPAWSRPATPPPPPAPAAAPSATDPARSAHRNGPQTAPAEAGDDRRNPAGGHEIPPGDPAVLPADGRRTGPRPEAHRDASAAPVTPGPAPSSGRNDPHPPS